MADLILAASSMNFGHHLIGTTRPSIQPTYLQRYLLTTSVETKFAPLLKGPWSPHSVFMKGSQARQVPALFSMQEPKTDLEAILQICTFLSAPAVATRP
jgi:hypothetical protein